MTTAFLRSLALPAAFLAAWLCLAPSPAAAAAAAPRESGLATRADAPALIATLQNPDASVAQKALACQHLAIVGSPDAIPALVGLLDHPQLAAQARNVLQNLPGPEASAALRAALPRLQGPFLVGVVNSLGIRRDADAVSALLSLEKNPLQGFWPQTLLALGRIASPQALEALRHTAASGPFDQLPACAEACILAGEALVHDGKTTQAAEFFDAVETIRRTRRFSLPPLRHAALRGAILARGDDGIPRLLDLFRDDDPALRLLAARIARELPGPAVSHALAAELAPAPDPVKVLLLGALADRPQPNLASRVEPLASSPNPEVRIAALNALGPLGNADSIPTLLRALTTPDTTENPESTTAAESLVRLTDPNAETVMIQALGHTNAPARMRLARILGDRNARGSADALMALAADPEPAVAKAAIDAVPAVATTRDLPKLIESTIQHPDPGIRDRAERAIYGVCLKQTDAQRRSEPLVRAFHATPSPLARTSLLQIMAMLADPPGADLIASACDDPVPEIKDTALRLLVNWPDTRPAPTLLRIFTTTSNEVHRTLALRGVVTLASLWTGDSPGTPSATQPRTPPRESIDWLTQAHAALKPDAEEKKILLSGLGDLNCEAGLNLLRPFLSDPTVQLEAEKACLRAIRNLTTPADKTAARPLLERIAGHSSDADTRKEAQALVSASSPGS